MDAFITRRGGAGGGLNFKVVGGMTKPGNPKENTIWVNTSTEISWWCISPVEPSEPDPGCIWIVYDDNSNISFNIATEDQIIIFTTGAKQYINGAWEPAETKIYINGEWKDFYNYLVLNGVATYPFSTASKAGESGSSLNSNKPVITQLEGQLKFQGSGRGNGIYYLDNVDLTGKTEIVLEGAYTYDGDGSGKSRNFIGVWSSLGAYAITNLVSQKLLEENGGTIPIDLDGTYTVGVALFAASELRITNFYIK